MTESREERPALRKDAERNRRRILDAASSVCAERGIEAPLEEIARRAGVGIATLYRRFPTRSALIEALFEDKAREYVLASSRALEHDDPWEGFCGFVERICEMQAEDRGFTDVLTASFPFAPGLDVSMDQARRNATKLIARARKQGSLRRDFVSQDLIWILIANGAYVQTTRNIAPDVWRRYVAFILEAARSDHASKLPPPPTVQELEQSVEEMGRTSAGD